MKGKVNTRRKSNFKSGRVVKKVIVVFQRPARPGEKKDVVGLEEGLRFKIQKTVEVETNIPAGPGMHSSEIVKRIVFRIMNKHRTPTTETVYAKVKEDRIAEKKGKSKTTTVFRTVMPRTTVPKVRLRNL